MNRMPGAIYIGCAGWSLRREQFSSFPQEGSHLARYASRFNCVEINSSFYRSHRISTYQRWAAATPTEFLFSVKLPKQITHVKRLKDSRREIAQFAAEVGGLGPKLGAVLVQLPPSLTFEPEAFAPALEQVRDAVGCAVFLEPRHVSWFEEAVESFLIGFELGRVAADPAVAPSQPLSVRETSYYRWHGSPRVYYSSYNQEELAALAKRLANDAVTSAALWCIFDNTAEGAATANALSMQKLIRQSAGERDTHG